MLTQQQLGGQEGVCTSEVTVPIKSTRERAHALSLLQNKKKTCTMRKMIDDDESLCLGTRRCAALHRFSRGNGWWNPSQRGNKLATSTLHDAMLPARSRNQRPGEENNRSEHWNTQNTVTLYRLMTWILLKTHTHTHTHNELECCRLQHTQMTGCRL